MNLRRILIISLTALTAATLSAKKERQQTVVDLANTISDDAIVYPESFEADTQRLLEGWYMKNYTATDDRYRTAPDVKTTDETIIGRLQSLPTVIEMPFNQIVRTYIDRYTQKSRPQVAAILGLSNYYMPIFEQALEAEGLPLELKYLPVIESGLDPNAVSKHGATGLWQFMLGSARGLGMEVNSLVDERRDPYLASAKAASFLKDLYAAYGDWTLAIAAYNCGPGAVNKAIRRAGGDPKSHNFWSIYYYLSPETRGYVPAFIATNYVMTYYPEHNISAVLPTKPLVTDTIGITSRVHFNQISKVLDIPVDELRVLNPQFRADIIPGTPEHPYNLILPSQQIHAYLMSEKEILNLDADLYARQVTAEPGREPVDGVVENEYDDLVAEEDVAEIQEAARKSRSTVEASAAETLTHARPTASAGGGKRTVTHKVAPGQTLAEIAGIYGVTVASIKQTNNLRRNAVRAGQQLKITTAAAVADEQGRPQRGGTAVSQKETARKGSKKAETKPKAAKPTTHRLKSGESLSSLSKKYGVSVEEIKKANGMKSDNLVAGEDIKIPAKGNVKSGKKSGKGSASTGSGKKKKKASGSGSGTSKKKKKKRK